MTITEFLEARIDEDEAVARAASHQKVAGPFHGNWRHNSLHLSSMEREDAEHIARHDPARVLAECAAKRAIIAEHGEMEVASLDRETWGQPFTVCRVCAVGVRQVVSPCPTLKALAAVYKNHADYREEWAI